MPDSIPNEKEILRALDQLLKPGESLPQASSVPSKQKKPSPYRWRITATYTYHDETRALRFQILRYPGKIFRFRKPAEDDPHNWTEDDSDLQYTLYKLPEIIEADEDQPIFIVEGEKDVDRLTREGLTATTNPLGPMKWRRVDDQPLHSRNIVILPDNDPQGYDHALDIAKRLHEKAAAIRLLQLPGLKHSEDISDWLDRKSNTPKRLLKLIQNVPFWSPRNPDPYRIETADPDRPPVIALTEVESRPVTWLWHDRIPLAALSLIAGDIGIGKSLFTFDLAARVSRGLPLPLSLGERVPSEARRVRAGAPKSDQPPLPPKPPTPSNIILISPEDAPDNTIRPRLEAANADLPRITILRARKQLLKDLERTIRRTHQVCLVIIDPITTCLPARQSLLPFAELAARYNLAILAVTHFDRAIDTRALYRAAGGKRYTPARIIHAIVENSDQPEQRLFIPVKSNLAPIPDPIAFTIQPPNGTLLWSAPSPAARGLARNTNSDPNPQRPSSTTDPTIKWLFNQLNDGPVPVAQINRAAGAIGITRRMLDRAKRELNVIATRQGFTDGRWTWHI